MAAGDLFPDPEILLDSDELRVFDVAHHMLWVDHHGDTKERERLFKGYDFRYLAVVPSGTDIHLPNNREYMGELEPASSRQKYVALSYVWGPPSVESNEPETESLECPNGTPLTDLPTVISDAMSVAINMGFDYLWVDKYCIDQKDEAVRHGQISQMDLYTTTQS
ncbi:C6 transcription factor [Colletotrichum asianum]|uniref:C6 transcription factor n=1 Tax=Colletotrichum asianum TaxID=702518 RepID=A0A8H3ZN91_9PEZI|nr:C6 transcription factor [Colletotrichum asianum]